MLGGAWLLKKWGSFYNKTTCHATIPVFKETSMTTLERLLLQNQQLIIGFFLENHYLKWGHHDYIPVPPPGKKFLWSDADKGGVSYVKNHQKKPQTNTNTYPVILRISGGFKVAPHLGSGKIRHENPLATWHRFPGGPFPHLAKLQPPQGWPHSTVDNQLPPPKKLTANVPPKNRSKPKLARKLN